MSVGFGGLPEAALSGAGSGGTGAGIGADAALRPDAQSQGSPGTDVGERRPAVIDYATYCRIRSLRQEQKLKPGQIAQQLQLDKKTVRYWLKHDYHQSQRPGRGSKL